MSIYLGNTEIGQIYLGSTEISEAYLGSTKVYEAGGGGGGGLPSDYTQLTFIRSNKTAYIDTGIKAKPSVGFEITFKSYDQLATSSGYGCVLGTRQASGTKDYQLTTYAYNAQWLGTFRWGNTASNISAQIDISSVNTISYKGGVYTSNGTVYAFTAPSTSESPYNIVLCALNNNGTIAQNGDVEIYAFKLYDGETLLRDFVPCKNSNNVCGLYDLVGGQFYSSGSSSPFTGE